MAKSSFQRKVKSGVPKLPGCHNSLYSHHLLVSTGVPDLDQLIGGGLPLGTLLLIEEDFSGGFSKLLLKYFLAEGVYHKNGIFASSLTQDPVSIVQNLPSFYEKEEKENTNKGKGDVEELKIAWRYKNTTLDSRNDGIKPKHSFNLLLPIQKDILTQCDIECCSSNDLLCDNSPDSVSVRLLKKIHNHVETRGFTVNSGTQEDRNILRIGVFSLGDVLWGDSTVQIQTFILALKALLRNCYGVGVLTIPSTLYQEDENIRSWILGCADYVIGLNSFDSQETANPVYKDYHGLLSIERIPSLGVLTPPLHLLKEDNELVFKSRRNKFQIEKFYLPPDLTDTASRDSKDVKIKKNIDF